MVIISVGVDYPYIPDFYDVIDEMNGAIEYIFTSYVQYNFEPPQEPIFPDFEGIEAFGRRNINFTMYNDVWGAYVIPKINTDLGKAGQDHLKNDKITYLVNMLNYFHKLQLRAAIIPLRHRDTTDLADVLRAVSFIEDPIPIWVKIIIPKIQDEKEEQEGSHDDAEVHSVSEEAVKHEENELDGHENVYPDEQAEATEVKNKDDEECDDEESDEENADEEEKEESPRSEAQKECDNKTWEWWSLLHERTLYHRNVGVVLEFKDRIPDNYLLKRWKGEPVTAIVVPIEAFYEEHGRPVLSVTWQQFIVKLVRYTDCKVFIGGKLGRSQRHTIENYLHYVRELNSEWDSRRTKFEKKIDDRSILIDNLQFPSEFVRDRADGYVDKTTILFYQKAFARVIEDKKAEKALRKEAPSQSVSHKTDLDCDDGIMRVAVISCECTVLVEQVLEKLLEEDLKNNYKIYVFVKCFSTSITKKDLGKGWWPDDIMVHSADDIPNLNPKCDVVIFDVLGLWGDGKLMSDIIDGADKILRDDCTAVPCQYISTVTPISSPSLWTQAYTSFDGIYVETGERLEYVSQSYLKNMVELGEAKLVFSRNQPLKLQVISENAAATSSTQESASGNANEEDNPGLRTLKWKNDMNCVIHGFMGKFSCKISIFRLKYSDEINKKILMKTGKKQYNHKYWIPMFIPIKYPLRMIKGEHFSVTFMRHATSDVDEDEEPDVWYHWQILTQTIPLRPETHDETRKQRN